MTLKKLTLRPLRQNTLNLAPAGAQKLILGTEVVTPSDYNVRLVSGFLSPKTKHTLAFRSTENAEKESLKNFLSPKTKHTLNLLPEYEERELKKLEFFQ